MGRLYIGTSGYSYQDWKGDFYPVNLDKKDYLSYYSSFFNTTEINFTYYSLPNFFVFRSLLKKVEDEFIFSVKAPAIFTHTLRFDSDDVERFLKALEFIVRNGQLGCILFQFPWSFKFSERNLDYLKQVRSKFLEYSICFEFRNRYWLNDRTLGCLEDLDVSFCNVDEPDLKGLLPPTDVNTNEIGYVRFHGRNADSWWNHKYSYQRYDYRYSEKELLDWVPRIKKLVENTKATYIYFNNHYQAKSVESARILINLLRRSQGI